MTSLEALEQRLAALEDQVADLRGQVRGAGALDRGRLGPGVVRPQPPPRPAPAAAPTATAPPPPPRPARQAKPRRELDFSKLLGAYGLAVAGGVVTVLGIVFLFVLAVNRGWINPELRLGFGASASIGVFAAGVWLRHRFGTTHAALAAVGAGIAGGYATLLAATALYEFVPQAWALVAAAGIAAAATVVALRWREELVAGLGLVGALLVPLMTVVEDGELTLIGTSFVALVFTATAAVSLHQRWMGLLVAGIVVSFVQIAGLVGQSEPTDWAVVWLTALFWALYLAVAAVEQLTSKVRLNPFAATLTLAATAFAAASAAQLFDGEVGGMSREGLALLVLSAAYLALGAAFLRGERDFSTLLWAVGLTLAAVAGAELLSGVWLAVAWAGEAAVLAWLAEATAERRFRLASAGYLALALAFTLGHEAPFSDLFELSPQPAVGVPSVLAVAAAALLVAWLFRTAAERGDDEGLIGTFLTDAVALLQQARSAFVWLAGALVVYAASLGLVELFARLASESREAGFERGHVAVSALWALVALALIEAGGRLRRLELSVAGLGLIAFAALKTVGYDHDELAPGRWSVAFVLVAAGALVCGFEYQRLGRDRWPGLRGEAAGAVAASALLGLFGILELAVGAWNGIDVLGGALVLLTVPYALLAAVAFRMDGLRDLATLLWSISLALMGAALFLLLEDVWLVAALATASAALSMLAVGLREPRFQTASALSLLTALTYTLALAAPPRDFVVAAEHPGDGVPSLVLVALAAIVFAVYARHETRAERPPLSWGGIVRSWEPTYRLIAFVGAGVLALYALSLGILELAELVSPAGVDVDFQRGHTAVSAAWGAIGLGLLTLGLVRRSRVLRLAGFALYGISLAKLFLYDLTYSSPMGRPLSFFAVGVLLLASGFFYQRLSERIEEGDRGGAKPA